MGYHTEYIGKYLNAYSSYDEPTIHIPPGWDRWIGYEGGANDQSINGAFKVNDQGKIVHIDANIEQDMDYFARKAGDYIRNRKVGNPCFLVVATNAPHEPALTSERNNGAYAGRTIPTTPAFNEADIFDKVPIWQDNPLLPDECPSNYHRESDLQCTAEVEETWGDRMESLMDVDDMVDRLITALRDKNSMRDTYIVFTSDNGFALYSNRIFSKGALYELCQRVPLIIRGPGVPQGYVDNRLVANIDLARTFAQWSGALTPSFVDGRSFVPILGNPAAQWRMRLLFEHRLGYHFYKALRTSADHDTPAPHAPPFSGLREGKKNMLITISTMRKDIPPLRRLRYERRLSIKELSETTGLSPNTIYRLEIGGRTTPSEETLRIIAAFYGLEAEQIAKMVPPAPAPRKAIKEIRDAKGITGRELAKLSGISYRTFLRAQRGEPVN